MTQPAPTAPGAPTNEPAPQNTPPSPAPTNQPGQQPPAPAAPGEDLASLPDWAQKAIRDARADAGKARTTAKQTAADEARTDLAKQVAKALGIQTGDEPPDPEALMQQVQEARDAAWTSGIRLQVFQGAATHGADPTRLLNSVSFLDSLDELVDVDPASADFATQLATKITAEVERNPYVQAGQAPAGPPAAPTAPRPDPSQGARGQAPQKFDGSLTNAIRAHYAGQK